VVPTPEFARQVVELGGWTVVMFIIILATVGLFREWWVPGPYWRREREKREAAERREEQNAIALAAIAKAMARDRRSRVSRGVDEPA
jgi:hypothetical protein